MGVGVGVGVGWVRWPTANPIPAPVRANAIVSANMSNRFGFARGIRDRFGEGVGVGAKSRWASFRAKVQFVFAKKSSPNFILHRF